MANTNNAFRGMDGVESLFKSKAELKAEKEAAKAKKKLEKSKVRQPLLLQKQQCPCRVWFVSKSQSRFGSCAK
jgi:hypothetical protein